jgi:hypothetical protein
MYTSSSHMLTPQLMAAHMHFTCPGASPYEQLHTYWRHSHEGASVCSCALWQVHPGTNLQCIVTKRRQMMVDRLHSL